MEVLVQEARDAFEEEQIVELRSEEVDDVEANVERIEKWIGEWRKDHGGDGGEVQAKGSAGKKDEDDPMFLHG